ncbi:MAG: CDGSH iron-sulfur domain-containing protein [Nitrospinae bacterium]|nr:CDGSH iron-sulfur domain-containing protein [Nitrospinota bacterium]
MDKKGPIKVTGEETMAVCKCMQSKHWPYCDATHHTLADVEPEIIQLDKEKTYLLCQCYKTKNPPFCDGSHNTSDIQ